MKKATELAPWSFVVLTQSTTGVECSRGQ